MIGKIMSTGLHDTDVHFDVPFFFFFPSVALDHNGPASTRQSRGLFVFLLGVLVGFYSFWIFRPMFVFWGEGGWPPNK